MAVLVRTIDKRQRISLIPLSDFLADSVFSDFSLEFRWATLHVLTPDGNILSAGVAVLYIVEKIGNFNPFVLRVLRNNLSQSFANYLYSKVSKYRSFLGRFLPNFPSICIKRY